MSHHCPGGLGRLRVTAGLMQLEVLDDEGHHLELVVPVDTSRRHALHHLHGLHTGAARAPLPERPQVDLLLRALAAVGAEVRALVVQADEPRFTLAVDGPDGPHELRLDPVDAAGLIFARCVRLEVRSPTPDWDGALEELLER